MKKRGGSWNNNTRNCRSASRKNNNFDNNNGFRVLHDIRPIIRGKAGKRTEFGAKLSASCYNGYVFLDHISWDNFNESGDLKSVVEDFKIYTGYNR